MPKIERWENFPDPVRQHLVERMRDRAIGIADLNQLRLWIETKPEVPEGDWSPQFLTGTAIPVSSLRSFADVVHPKAKSAGAVQWAHSSLSRIPATSSRIGAHYLRPQFLTAISDRHRVRTSS